MNGLFRYFWANCLGKKTTFMVNDLDRIDGSMLISLADGFDELGKTEQDERLVKLIDVLSEGVVFYKNGTEYMLARQSSNCDFCWGGRCYIKKIYKALKNNPFEDWEFVLWGLNIKKYYENIKWSIPKGMERYASDFMQVPFWESIYVSSGNLMISSTLPVYKTLVIASGEFTTMDSISYTKDLFLTKGVKVAKTFEYTEAELTTLALKNSSVKSIFDVALKNELEDSIHSLILNFAEVSAILAYTHARMTSLISLVKLHDVLSENKHDKMLKILDIHHDVLLEETSIPTAYEEIDEGEVELPKEKYFKSLEDSWIQGYTPNEVINDTEESHIWDKDEKAFTQVDTPVKYYKGLLVPHQNKVLLNSVPICKQLMLLKKKNAIAASLIETILIYIGGLNCQQVEDDFDNINASIEAKARPALKQLL